MKATDLPEYYNACDLLERNLPERAQKVALYSSERQMTFQEVSEEANQVGNALKQLGVRFGDFVGILAPDSGEWMTSWFGVLKIGAIAIGMNTQLGAAEYDYILRDSRARALIVHESLLPTIEALRDQHPTLEHVIVIGQPQRETDAELVRSGVSSFRALIGGQAKTLVAARTHRDDFCTLNYSSGTTGKPKGILHAHKDYALTAQLSGVELLGIQESDRTFSSSKLSFLYGMSNSLIFPWYVGASVVLYAGSSRTATALLETIERFQPTLFFSVPTVYITILQNRNFALAYDLSSLRLCVSAGEVLPASVWRRWYEKTGLELIDYIGNTETIALFLSNRVGEIRPGSSGKPTLGFEVKIVDDEGQHVAQGEIGNLMVKGETTALFYLHQYEKSRHTFRGEWLFTGDQYYVDEEGYYWHAGRSDDMLKVRGLWVSPIEIEHVINNHPAVRECAVVGQRDQAEFVKPKAFICLNEGFQPEKTLLTQLLRHCQKELAVHKRPRWFEFVDALPRTATGKIQRFKLRS